MGWKGGRFFFRLRKEFELEERSVSNIMPDWVVEFEISFWLQQCKKNLM